MFRLFRPLMLLLAPLLTLLAAAPAHAWWEWGHQTTAAIAWGQVTPATRAAIRALLAQSRVVHTPTCPLRTIADASVWPDCIKTLKDRFSYAYSWHYQDVDICRPFDLTAACADGNCVSKQIARNARLLADRTLPVQERITALAFLVHFVGDIHQPLHAGEHHDQGGNAVKAHYGAIGGRMNLHSIWDGLLAERAISTPPAGADGILREIPVGARVEIAAGSVEDWSRESWAVARDTVYPAVLADPCGPLPVAAPVMDAATIARLVPVVRLQIARGGLRLARLLDAALDGAERAAGAAGDARTRPAAAVGRWPPERVRGGASPRAVPG